MQFIGVYCKAFPPGERVLRICKSRTKIQQSLCAELKLCAIYSSGKGNSVAFLPGRGLFFFTAYYCSCIIVLQYHPLFTILLVSGCIALHWLAISSPLLAFHNKFPFPLFLLLFFPPLLFSSFSFPLSSFSSSS